MPNGDKILLVDDDSDIRFMVSKILKRDGYKIVEASNGIECLEKIRDIGPDLVILDIMMPYMDGWEVCRRIKETTPHLPVSMLSAKGGEEDIKRSLESGADRHLTKPIARDEFLGAVQDLLGGIRPNHRYSSYDIVNPNSKL